MRRAVLRALRTTCQLTARGVSRRSALLSLASLTPTRSTLRLTPRLTPTLPLPLLSAARFSTAPVLRAPAPPNRLHASMHVRQLSAVLVSGLVGYGAYYAYQDKPKPVTTPLSQASHAAFTTTSTNPAATRNVLVVGANELSTGTLVGDEPLSKYTDDAGRRVIEMLSPAQVTERLRQNEEAYGIRRGQGVVRYDLVQVASNYPIEDDHAEKIVEVPASDVSDERASTDWMFWGVFDGHSGWTTSAKLRQTLISYVANALNETHKAAPATGPAADAIDAAIKGAFVRLDDDIVQRAAERVLAQSSKTVAAEMLTPALSGSCALLSFYDSRSQLLRVACTGDSRAVLGRRGPSGKWTATPLSVDQTGSNPDEEARLRAAHPGEQHVVRNGRILGGLEPSRAFGDASYKWTRDVAGRLARSFFVRNQSPLLRTPPYVTAEPVVTTTKIEPEHGDFLVMATDGLWEMLTNEEAVGLVGSWIEQGHVTPAAGVVKLQVEGPAGDQTHGERTPYRLRQWGVSPDASDRFVVRDKNAATHLVRNALGGRNEEQVSALLTLPAPFSRRYRDDLTVQVVFFGNQPAAKDGPGGGVESITEATGPGPASAEPKAKL